MNLRQPFRYALRISGIIALAIATAGPAFCQSASHVVIGEVYGGGGNSGALYTHDFIELYNPTSYDVVMSGWSVQYQSGAGTGTFTSVAKFSGTIRAHGFFLIQGNPGSGGTLALPAPDAVAGFAMAAAAGKVALTSDTLPVAGPADTAVVDFVGYGTANLFEGSGPAPAPGNTTSVERKASDGSDEASMSAGGSEEHSGNGRDSGDNLQDFLRRDPDPQNDGSPVETPGGAAEVSVPYGGRWNLVSLPLAVADPSLGALFPGSISPLYRYDGGYSPESSAVPGAGYWIRFAGPETAMFSGTSIDPETLTLVPGWNLIGTIASGVGAGSVIQLPGEHLQGDIFEFDGGYRPADTLRPGRGYWARSTSGGMLVLSSGVGTAAREVSAEGGARGLQPVVPAIRELPPPPPDGIVSPDGDAGQARDEGGVPSPSDPGGAGPEITGIYPNPFNPSARIGFFIPAPGSDVDMAVFDMAGRRIATLLRGFLPGGYHSARWDARMEDGRPVSSGIYLARLEANGMPVMRKLLHMK